jgi:hypothetical protein
MLRLMTTVLLWLGAYSIIGCASKPILPERPVIGVCVADGEGGAMCHDPRTGVLKPKENGIAGFVCFEPTDYQNDEEWILNILGVQRGI